MAKRRRERDRPKVPPDALYNPNKRILLSYESGDEEDDATPTWTPPTAVPAFTPTTERINGEFTSAVDTKLSDVEVRKAAHASDAAGEGNGGLAEHSHGSEEESGADETCLPQPTSRVGRNVVTGQAPTLGSLAFQWDDADASEDYGSDEAEAMAYLRSVRSERQGMPTVFFAQETEQATVSENGVGDTRGFLDDHAYVAQPFLGPIVPMELRAVDPQEAFTQSLKRRFLRLRDRLHDTPSAEALASLTADQLTSFPYGDRTAYAMWRHMIVSEAPVFTQVQMLDQQAVRHLLNLVRRQLLRQGKPLTRNVSAWIWSLLARLDDVGTLTNDEVSVVRELGKQAILMSVFVQDPAMAEQLHAVQKENHVERTDVADAAEEALPDTGEVEGSYLDVHEDEGAATSSHSEGGTVFGDSIEPVTSATLDMILVVAGEVFGQRDLLDFRPSWSAKDDT